MTGNQVRSLTAQERRWVQRLRRVLADQPDSLTLVLDYADQEMLVIDRKQYLIEEEEAHTCDTLAIAALCSNMEVIV